MTQTLDRSSSTLFSIPSLKSVLQDIAAHVQIRDNFRIEHPDYQPFELPSEIVDRFSQLPSEQRFKYLILHCRSFLYGIYYNASMRSTLSLDSVGEQPVAQQNFENNTVLGVDPDFFEQLHQSNQGNGFFDDGWTVLRHESDGTVVVQRGLILHLDPNRHLALGTSTEVGNTIAVRMPKNVVQNGFYMAVGNAGIDRRFEATVDSTTVRVYFNYSAEGAIEVMHKLTEQLNTIEVPFSFKTLYNPSDYSRYDSGVLYFNQSDYPAVWQVLKTLYSETQSYFQPEIPLFTKQLAPGLGLAEEPKQKFASQESFGMNRCQIVAEGLVTAQQCGNSSQEANLDAILQAFNTHRISCEKPHLNPDSEDIYFPL